MALMQGMLIYRRETIIKGYGPFCMEVRFSRKDKVFYIDYPVYEVSDNITKVDYVVNESLVDAEKEWHNKVRLFEMAKFNYRHVILYQVEEKGSFQDGSGTGFVFNWGVFRVVEEPDSEDEEVIRDRYLFERGHKKIHTGYHEAKNWQEMPYSITAEEFFKQISLQIETMYDKLKHFIDNADFSDVAIESFSSLAAPETVNNV